MLHTAVPLSIVFPDGQYPPEWGLIDRQPEAKQGDSAPDQPLSTAPGDHLTKHGAG